MQNSVLAKTEKFSHVWLKKNVFIHPTKTIASSNFLTKINFFHFSLFLIETFFFPFFSKARDGLLSKLNCLIEEGMEKAKFLLSPILGFLLPLFVVSRVDVFAPSKWGYSYST